MDKQQLPYLLAFNCIYKLRSSSVVAIVSAFGGDIEAAWHSADKWAEYAGIRPSAVKEAAEQKKSVDPSALYSQFLAQGCGITSYLDEDYPLELDAIIDPPLVLFYHGILPHASDLRLAIIGSRRATAYGKQVAEIFSSRLAEEGAWIVSGMARGIDSICHKAAIAAGGKTVAVLGCGLDIIYPPENKALYGEITRHGAVISEFPFGTAALAHNFPRRNRIISGISQGVIVVEADLNSGTMHTVNHALEQGKEIFAVPGPITSPCSRGTNKLIKEAPGAVMAASVEDVLDRFCIQPVLFAAEDIAAAEEAVDEREKILLELLSVPVQFDRIGEQAELDISPAELAAVLTMLEIKGAVKQLPGKYYQRTVKKL